jgi:hypothetical protein
MKPAVKKISGLWRVIDPASFRAYTFRTWGEAIEWAVHDWEFKRLALQLVARKQ